MAEPQKQQMGDGSDNIGQAAGQAAKAAKNAGKQAAKQAAKKGAEAAANAAAATVKAGVEGGKAVAEIAAGTAAGGPWGAIISAAWAMRHTLFKILVCLCLSVVFLIVMIVELPGIIINKALGLDGNEPTVSITEIYENLSETVSDIVQAGYDASMAEVERLLKIPGAGGLVTVGQEAHQMPLSRGQVHGGQCLVHCLRRTPMEHPRHISEMKHRTPPDR